MGGNSKITVVIVCFNYGRFLPEAVESVLSQAGGAPRVIVVDDGSTEPGNAAVLEALPDAVSVIRQPRSGVSVARNAGLSAATTALVLVMDADDRLASGALAAMRGALEHDQTIGYAYGLMEQFGSRSGVLRFPPFDPYGLLFRHTIGLSALMRREVFEATGGFDPAFTAFEDWELWVNALDHGFIGRQLDLITLEYRRHEGSKHAADRAAYRAAWRAMRRKHSALYARADQLGASSSLGATDRLTHRFLWGPRPWPERLEQVLYARLFR